MNEATRQSEPEADRLVNCLRAEQCRRWRAGEKVLAESYFADHPELLGQVEDALVLVGGEVALRRERGEAPTADEYRERFPHLAADLDWLFAAQQAFESRSSAVDSPNGLVHIGDSALVVDRPPEVPGYEVQGELGRGSAGVVYRARQIALNRIVALKVVRAGALSGSTAANRFRAEAQAVARLQHPNVVQIFEVGEALTAGGERVPYLALEYVDGPTMSQVCAGQPQPFQRAARWIETLANALHAAHQQGIVHRDLKPANILVAPEGVLKVADFGLAKLLDQEGDRTVSGTIVGTPTYMAPELAEGHASQASGAADVYSLGAILYELVAGRPPFSGESMLEIIRRVVRDEPPSPAQLRPDLPRDLQTICWKCLEKEPNRRYPTAAALAEDLRRFQAGEPVTARPVGTIERSWRWCWRNPRVAGLAATVASLLVVLAVGATIAAIYFQKSEHRASERLLDSLIAQAEANRLSRRPGQRFGSLRLLKEALQLAQQLGVAEARGDQLRTAAIAALAMPDLEPGESLLGRWPEGTVHGDVDDSFTRYVRSDRKGNCSIRTLIDDKELFSIPGTGLEGRVWLSPDGMRLMQLDKANYLRAWRLDGPQPLLIHESAACSLPEIRSDSRVATYARMDGVIRAIDLDTGRVNAELPPVTLSRLVSVVPHPVEPIVALCSYFHDQVLIRDLRNGAILGELPHPAPVHHVAWSPDGRTIATAGNDYEVRLFDAKSHELIRNLGECDQGHFLRFSHRGDMIAGAGWAGTLYIRDVGTGKVLMRAPSNAAVWTFPRFSFNDRHISGSYDGDKLVLWNVASNRECGTLQSRHIGPLDGLGNPAVHPNGRLLATTTNKGISFWDLDRREEVQFLPLPNPTGGCKFAADGSLLCGMMSGIWRWPVRIETGRDKTSIHLGPPARLTHFPPSSFSGSRDLRTIAIACRAVIGTEFYSGLWFWQSNVLSRPRRVAAGCDMVYCEISPNGRWAHSSDHYNSSLEIWDAAGGGAPICTLPRGMAAFSPDSRRLVTTSEGGRTFHRNAEDSEWIDGPRIGLNQNFVVSRPDGEVLADSLPAGVIRLLEPSNGKELVRLVDPEQRYVHASFSPDGSRIVGQFTATEIRVWDLQALRRELAALGLDRDDLPFPTPRADDSASMPPPMELTFEGTWLLHPVIYAAATVLNSTRSVADRPSGASDYLRRGRAFAELGLRDLARRDYDASLRARPDYAEAAFWRGADAVTRQQWDVAVSDLSIAAESTAMRKSARLLRAMALRRLGRASESAADRAGLGVSEKEQAVWYHSEARSYLMDGDYPLAIACFEEALYLNPDDAIALRWLANALLLGPRPYRDPPRALELVRRLHQLQPVSFASRQLLGVAYLHTGNYAAARDELAMSLDTCSKEFAPQIEFYLAIACDRLGETAAARAHFLRAESAVSSANDTLRTYGRFLLADLATARMEAHWAMQPKMR